MFARYTGEVFDPISPAAAAADVTIGFILSPDRAARMVAQHALDPTLPGLTDVIEALRKATLPRTVANAYEEEIRRATARVLVERLMALAGNAPMPQVRAHRVVARCSGIQSRGFARRRERRRRTRLIAADIRRFLERPIAPITMPALPDAPPGAPIGDPRHGLARAAPVPWRARLDRYD